MTEPVVDVLGPDERPANVHFDIVQVDNGHDAVDVVGSVVEDDFAVVAAVLEVEDDVRRGVAVGAWVVDVADVGSGPGGLEMPWSPGVVVRCLMVEDGVVVVVGTCESRRQDGQRRKK